MLLGLGVALTQGFGRRHTRLERSVRSTHAIWGPLAGRVGWGGWLSSEPDDDDDAPDSGGPTGLKGRPIHTGPWKGSQLSGAQDCQEGAPQRVGDHDSSFR
jgi:hypothetical protein